MHDSLCDPFEPSSFAEHWKQLWRLLPLACRRDRSPCVPRSGDQSDARLARRRNGSAFVPRFRDCWALHRATAFLHVIAAQPTRTRQSGLGTIARWWRSRRHQFVGGGSANLLPSSTPNNQVFWINDSPHGLPMQAAALLVHRSPIEGVRLYAAAQTIEFELENWRRRPDLNRGSRFCRFR
jgi:hypothetical protein